MLKEIGLESKRKEFVRTFVIDVIKNIDGYAKKQKLRIMNDEYMVGAIVRLVDRVLLPTLAERIHTHKPSYVGGSTYDEVFSSEYNDIWSFLSPDGFLRLKAVKYTSGVAKGYLKTIHRVEQSLPALRAAGCIAAESSDLQFRFGADDQHGIGESSSLLRIGDHRFLYKPIAHQPDSIVYEIFEWWNNTLSATSIPTRRVYASEGFDLFEYINHVRLCLLDKSIPRSYRYW